MKGFEELDREGGIEELLICATGSAREDVSTNAEDDMLTAEELEETLVVIERLEEAWLI